MFRVREPSTNIPATPIIMHGDHQTGSIPPHMEDRELSHLSCASETGPQLRKRGNIAAFHLSAPVFQGAAGLCMSGRKLVQPCPGNDMPSPSRIL
jgi:hypothetical protein